MATIYDLASANPIVLKFIKQLDKDNFAHKEEYKEYRKCSFPGCNVIRHKFEMSKRAGNNRNYFYCSSCLAKKRIYERRGRKPGVLPIPTSLSED